MAEGSSAREIIPHPTIPYREANGRLLPGGPGSPGLPSTYTEAVGERIAALVATSARGLSWICKNHDGLPGYDTVLHWEDRHQEFGKLMAAARRKQALTLIDECLEIADDASGDRILIETKAGIREVADLAGISRAKIRIDTRVRLAKMFDPQRFGDRLDINARVGGFASQDEVIDELD